MSFIMYQVKCKRCGQAYNTAFGIVGTTLIADPLKKCQNCGGVVEKCGDDWVCEPRENKIQVTTGRNKKDSS